jgi:hypothetical protein
MRSIFYAMYTLFFTVWLYEKINEISTWPFQKLGAAWNRLALILDRPPPTLIQVPN